MKKAVHSCIKGGDEKSIVKNGKSKNGKQRYKCKECGVRFLTRYTYYAYEAKTDDKIKSLMKEGVGIRSSARLLGISKNTVINRILKIGSRIRKPLIKFGARYELDEMCTHVARKKGYTWVVYAIDKNTKKVVDIRVGKRQCIKRGDIKN